MNLLRYFDLNYRLERARKRQNFVRENNSKSQEEQPKRNFWFNVNPQEEEQEGDAEEDVPLAFSEQILMYLGVLLGVCFRDLMLEQEAQVNLPFAAMIALAVVPIVFEKLSIKPRSPLLFRFGLFVQHGMFWDAILEVAGSNLGVR